MIGPRTKAILVPNLIGNVPRLGPHPRDRRRARPQGDRGLVRRARRRRCAARRPARAPTSRVTSFALVAHHHRGRHRRDGVPRRRRARRPLPAAAPLGPPLRGADLRLEEGRQALLLRRSTATRVRQPLHLRRGRLELRAVRALRRVRARAAATSCPTNLARRQRNFDAAVGVLRHATPTCSCCRARPPSVDTGWHMFPVLIRPESGVRRAEFQEHMEAHGVDTRMVWTGNVTAPARVRGASPHRAPAGGLPERRPGDGAGADPAVEPQPRRRRHRLHVGDRRGVPPGARLAPARVSS